VAVQNSLTYQDAIWDVDSVGSKEACVRGMYSLSQPDEYD